MFVLIPFCEIITGMLFYIINISKLKIKFNIHYLIVAIISVLLTFSPFISFLNVIVMKFVMPGVLLNSIFSKQVICFIAGFFLGKAFFERDLQ